MNVLHSICQQIWKTQKWSQDWKRSAFIPIPKKGSAKECSNYHVIGLISHASKVILKIFQARVQQYVNQELSDVQTEFRKGRGIRDQFANIQWITEKAREFQKNIYFCFNYYAKAFDCVDHKKLWKIIQEMGIPDNLTSLLKNQCQVKKQQLELDMEQQTVENYSRDGNTRPLTCLLSNLYAGQEATVRTGHGTTDWLQIRKEYIKAVYCHPAYLTYMQSTS